MKKTEKRFHKRTDNKLTDFIKKQKMDFNKLYDKYLYNQTI